jgi:hypothetical protein
MWYYPANGEAEASSAEWAPLRLDTTTPNVARIYDFLLGGKSNYAADRAAAKRVLSEIPHSAVAAQQNRAFLRRAVRLLADSGIRQFLDIGSGLPTRSNVHEIAQRAVPKSRVVYVDYDSVVVGHARALLEKGSPGVSVVVGDLRDPGKVIRDTEGLLDFRKPVAVLLFAILHFLRDDDKPHEVVRTLTDALAAGGALAVSHITGEGTAPEKNLAAQQVYQGASAPVVPRSRDEVTRFFDGLELMEPGVVDINLWPVKAAEPDTPLSFYGGVAWKA